MPSFRKFLTCAAVITGAIAFAPSASALTSKWQSADYLQARLLSAEQAVGQEETLTLALEVRLADNWHAYWRMPGDAGLPPQLNWTGSDNIQATEILWPIPKRFDEYGFQTFGYEGTVIFPIRVTPEKAGEAIKADLAASIMVCHEICVPQDISMSLTVPAGAAEASESSKIIEGALSKVPSEDMLPQLKIENLVVGPEAVVMNVYSHNGFERTDVFIEAGETYITAQPEITVDQGDPRKAMIKVALPDLDEGEEKPAEMMMWQNLTVTVVNGDKWIEKDFSF